MCARIPRSILECYHRSIIWGFRKPNFLPTTFSRGAFMKFHVGTSGYSYKEWKGSFYPEKLPAKDFLKFYGEHFSTVEINNTFYRLPKESVVESWTAQVPDTFRFVAKARQVITHFKRLKECEK